MPSPYYGTSKEGEVSVHEVGVEDVRFRTYDIVYNEAWVGIFGTGLGAQGRGLGLEVAEASAEAKAPWEDSPDAEDELIVFLLFLFFNVFDLGKAFGFNHFDLFIVFELLKLVDGPAGFLDPTELA